MTTLTVELTSSYALSILKELENLDVLHIVKRKEKTPRLAAALHGCLSASQAAQMNSELEQVRGAKASRCSPVILPTLEISKTFTS